MDSRKHPRSLNDIYFQDVFIRVIFLLSKLAGIFPCMYTNGQLFASIPLCIWSSLIACLMTFSTVYFNINLFISTSEVKLLLVDSLTQIIVSFWFCFCFWVLYLVSVTNSIHRMRNTNIILHRLNEVDRKLPPLEVRKTWRQRSIYFAKIYFCGVALAINYYVNSPLISLPIFLKVPLFLPFFCSWLCTTQFTSLADQVSLRLDGTCAALDDIVFTRVFSISGKKLNNLSQVHEKLCDIYVILDRSYALLITCLISACFNGVFIPVYVFLKTFYLPESGLEVNVIVLMVSWITISLYTIWQIVSTTSGITSKLRGFNLTLYKLMKSDKRNEVLGNSKLRLHISVKREVVFTGKGFFKLDFTLLQMIVSSAVNYLVILLQFSLPSVETPTETSNSNQNNSTSL